MIHLSLGKWPSIGHLLTVYPTLICLCWFVYGIYICQSSSVRRNLSSITVSPTYKPCLYSCWKYPSKPKIFFMTLLVRFRLFFSSFCIKSQVKSNLKNTTPHTPRVHGTIAHAQETIVLVVMQGHIASARISHTESFPASHVANAPGVLLEIGPGFWRRDTSFNNRSLFASQLCHPPV